MAKFAIHDMDLYYNTFHALKNINLELPEHQVSAFIGPSGCGKSTLLKSLNRMNDLVEAVRSPAISAWTGRTFTAIWM